MQLDPWQQYALDDIMAVQPNGWPVARTAALIVTRQNGKGSTIEAYILEGLFLSNLQLIVYTAHETKTAGEMFSRIRQMVDPEIVPDSPLAKRVKRIRLVNGEWAVELKSGARLLFLARTKSSGRGFTGDRIILDEAQELKSEHMEALVPTLVTRRHAQVFMAGSAPVPHAEVLPGIMDRGRAGTDASLCYLEWSVPDPLPGQTINLDDQELWRQSNPGFGIRLFGDAIAAERTNLSDEGFARERLGIRGGGGFSSVIDAPTWQSLADPESKRRGAVAFAVDVDPERRHASICMAGTRADGLFHVEVVQRGPGTDWLAPRLAELDQAHQPSVIVLDPASPAGSLLSDLKLMGLEITTDPEKQRGVLLMTAQKYAQACGAFFDATVGERLRHLGQPSLDAAVDAGRKRQLGDAWAWHRRDNTADITPLVASTLALYGHRVGTAPAESVFGFVGY